MMDSKTVIAVNKDPDAEITRYSDYVINGDLYEILPVFIEELKKRKKMKDKN